MVFVLDSSGSIGDNNFETTMLFVKNTVRGLDIEQDKTRVGFVQFSTAVNREGVYKLNSFDSREAATDAISRMRWVHT